MAASNSSSSAGKNKAPTRWKPWAPFFSKQVDRRKVVTTEKRALATRLSSSGDAFPGSEHWPADWKRWMAELGADRLRVHQVVWLGMHDSATNKIGVLFVTRPFVQCQSMFVYEQLATGVRVIDMRVQEERALRARQIWASPSGATAAA